MVAIGDKYKEIMVPFPGHFFSWEYEVIGFETRPYGKFANVKQTYDDGTVATHKISIAIDLLEEGVFYKKVA